MPLPLSRKRIDEVAAGHVQRRHQAEDEGGHDGDRQGRDEQTVPFSRMTASAGMIRGGITAMSAFKPPQAMNAPRVAPPRARTQAFHQELAHEPPAARAQGRPDGELLLARRGPGQEEIGHVAAADEQEQPDGGEDDEEGGPEASHHHVRERLDLELEALGIVLRVDRGQPVAHDVEVRFRLRGSRPPASGARAGTSSAGTAVPVAACAAARLFRDPEVGVAPGEARRHDSDQGFATCR